MKFPTAFAILLTLAALTVNAEEGKDAKQQKSKGDGCVFSRNITDWQVIDNRTLAVWAPTRKTPYIVELAFPATGLKFEHSLGFEDRNSDGRFCDYGGDAAVSDRIPVRSVRRVDAEEVKLLLAEAQKPKEKPQATLPEQADMKSDRDEKKDAAEKPKN